MTELINKRDNRAAIQLTLLASVSAAALIIYASSVGVAEAGDTDRPLIWLEASGQFDQLYDSQSIWLPEFAPGYATGPLVGQYTGTQHAPRSGYDADASVLFQASGNAWQIFAAAHVGRARRNGSVAVTQHQSAFGRYGTYTRYNATVHNSESHDIIDFQVGKDVGLGTIRPGAASVIRMGVRVAQFRSRSDIHISTEVPISHNGTAFNDVHSRISRDFAGLGPSIAWDASFPVDGNDTDGHLSVDWAVNAALLIGRQKVKQETAASYQGEYYNGSSHTYVAHRQTVHPTRLRRANVTVPNLGGSIGISYRMNDAKLSLGYRADWYRHVLDGGIDTWHPTSRGFFGPYASISIGFGSSAN